MGEGEKVFDEKMQMLNYTIEFDSPSLSAKELMPGRLRIVPITGTRRRKLTATGKKPLKSKKNPYISKHIPTTGQPIRTTSMPPTKNPVALNLCRWKKKRNVRSSPITQPRPLMKRMFPKARSPLSKKKSTPRKRNMTPNPARPTPIFWQSVISIILKPVFLKTASKSFVFTQTLNGKSIKLLL